MVFVAAVAQTAWVRWAGPLDVVNPGATPMPFGDALRLALGRQGFMYRQMIGVLNWTELPPPFVTVLAWTLALGVVVALGLAIAPRLHALAIVGVAVATVAIPVVLEASRYSLTGPVWQGRYTMPIAVGVPILSGLALSWSERGRTLASSRLVPLLGGAFVVGSFAAFYWDARRLTVGYSGRLLPWIRPGWEPPVPVLPPAGGVPGAPGPARPLDARPPLVVDEPRSRAPPGHPRGFSRGPGGGGGPVPEPPAVGAGRRP
ncbi:MAG: hypothetical protein M5U14_13855 [Acidimicrobiia bacterium]|nr:hypothetical protein [Acidimicrobiia bacterium]